MFDASSAPLSVNVSNEIGRLRSVLVHCPGSEIVRMTQHELDRMLFDDILAEDAAREEHALMSGILTAAGANVIQLRDLLISALTHAPAHARAGLTEHIAQLAGVPSIASALAEMDPATLATALITGVPWTQFSGRSLSRAWAELEQRGEHGIDRGPAFALRPLPNLMFLRDPCISVFNGVLTGRMASAARAREPLLVAFALVHAPQIQAKLAVPRLDQASHAIEGGDVLVLSPQTLVIGASERTRPHTIEQLTREHLFETHPKLERVIVLMMPHARSMMHLDTILTQVDHHLFLGHEPLIAGPRGQGRVAQLTRDGFEAPSSATLLDLLREVQPDAALLPCGGHDPIDQEREQWTDGANAVALSPGHILLYARNRRTVATLAEHGFESVQLFLDVPADVRAAQVREAMQKPRVVFTFTGSELSRARGGGRCLTMPLHRDALDLSSF